MYRRVLSCAAKMVAGAGSLQLGAAAVALTDKQLSKKAEWYQKDVHSLEDSLKALSKYGFVENEEQLNEAEEVFKRYVDLNNPHVLWGLSRTLSEKAELIKDIKKKAELLHEAVHLAEKALVLEGKSGIPQAHKWFAIAAMRLVQVDKKAAKCSKLRERIYTHLKRATELNSKDPFAWYLLGTEQYNNKDYKEAIASFQKAESIKPGFSAANLYHLGDAQRLNGQKSEAVETLKTALSIRTRNQLDGKAKSSAKRILLTKLKQNEHDIEVNDDI